MGNFDQYVAIGEEATYGTAVAPTRAYEAMTDAFRRTVVRVDSGGIRAGRQGKLASRSRTVTKGGVGGIEAVVLTEGFGLLFKNLLGTASIAQIGATAAWLQKFVAGKDAPGGSHTIEVGRARADTGDIVPFRYHGGKVLSWGLTCSVDEAVKVSVSYDTVGETEETTATNNVGSLYPEGAKYIWEDFQVTLDGSQLAQLRGFSINVDLGLGVDTSFLKGTAVKEEPLRVTDPVITGTLDARFTGTDEWEDFVNGTIVTLVAVATYPVEIAPGHNPFVRLTLPAIKFTGETPTSAPDEYTVQPLPFEAYWNESDPLATLAYQSVDVAH